MNLKTARQQSAADIGRQVEADNMESIIRALI
jgi:hypothetical protein